MKYFARLCARLAISRWRAFHPSPGTHFATSGTNYGIRQLPLVGQM
jgi:hypothetical protein